MHNYFCLIVAQEWDDVLWYHHNTLKVPNISANQSAQSKTCLSPLCWPKIQQRLLWDLTWASVVRILWLRIKLWPNLTALQPQYYSYTTKILLLYPPEASHGSPHFHQPFWSHLQILQAVTCSSALRVFLPCVFHFALLWCTNALSTIPFAPAFQKVAVWHPRIPFLLSCIVFCKTKNAAYSEHSMIVSYSEGFFNKKLRLEYRTWYENNIFHHKNYTHFLLNFHGQKLM